MLTLTIQTGLRISELIALNRDDITLGTGANVHTVGKGRKAATHTADPNDQAILKAWLASAQAPPTSRCSRPAPASASAATRSNAASPSTSRPRPRAAHHSPANT